MQNAPNAPTDAPADASTSAAENAAQNAADSAAPDATAASVSTRQPVTQAGGIEATKAIARAFFERFDANDIDGALALFSEDASYWLAGKPAELPGTGLLSKPQIARVFRRMTALLEDGLRMQLKSIIAEGDVAAAEVVSHGVLKNGRHYDNEYHVRIQVRDGLICAVREYYDSLHVHSVWYAPSHGAVHLNAPGYPS